MGRGGEKKKGENTGVGARLPIAICQLRREGKRKTEEEGKKKEGKKEKKKESASPAGIAGIGLKCLITLEDIGKRASAPGGFVGGGGDGGGGGGGDRV